MVILTAFEACAKAHGFRIADLLMQKRPGRYT